MLATARLCQGCIAFCRQGPGCEAQSESRADGIAEDMIGETGRVGVVFFDAKIGFMVEPSIEDMGRVAHCRVDDFGMKGRMLIGDMGIEGDTGVVSVL